MALFENGTSDPEVIKAQARAYLAQFPSVSDVIGRADENTREMIVALMAGFACAMVSRSMEDLIGAK